MIFTGSNGRMYRFLLKGHEDLRQDERVMQLFGLVNALLSNDPETSKRDLLIKCVMFHQGFVGILCFMHDRWTILFVTDIELARSQHVAWPRC